MEASQVIKLVQRLTEMRTGIGFDVHQLKEGRPLIVGGVHIPHPLGLLGHSDADVLVHAVMDALLGAAKLADIGVHFPDSDPQWKDANSLHLASAVAKLVERTGWEIVNIDALVVAQRPKLSPHFKSMAANIAQALGIEAQRVSIKATTTERLGFCGQEEGVAALASALLRARLQDQEER